MIASEDNRSLGRVCFVGAVTALLLGLFYLHVLVSVNPVLIYEADCPSFLTTLGFFKSFLGTPGGLTEYASVFFSQLNYYPWVGALVITLTAGLMCLATRSLLDIIRPDTSNSALSLIPAVLLLLVYNRYEHNPAASGQILGALVFGNIYARISFRGSWLRLPTFIFVSGIAYYLTGSGYVLFAVLCGILELVKRRSEVLGVFCLLCGGAVPAALAMYSYEVTYAQAYAPLLPFSKEASPTFAAPIGLQDVLHLGLVSCFPLVEIWAGLSRQRDSVERAIRDRVRALRIASEDGQSSSDCPEAISPRASGSRAVWAAGLVIVFGAAAAIIGVDRDTRILREVHHAARTKAWAKVLEKASNLPRRIYDLHVMKDVNTALYHTGRLPYEMFAYPQNAGMDSILLTAFAQGTQRAPSPNEISEVFFDLGFINESEHFAHESLETNGPSPEVLKRLAKINILKGSPMAARTFLCALRENLLYRKWADDYLRRLQTDPLMTSDEELSEARSRMIRGDYVMMGRSREAQLGPLIIGALERQLRTEARNRKTFEHLMGYYLLARNLDKVVAGLGYLEYFEYTEIPRHYEEAALLYAAMHPEKKLQIQGGSITKETLSRFQGFLEILTSYRGDQKGAHDALIRDHDRSYFLYYTTGFSDSRFAGIGSRPAAVTGATK